MQTSVMTTRSGNSFLSACTRACSAVFVPRGRSHLVLGLWHAERVIPPTLAFAAASASRKIRQSMSDSTGHRADRSPNLVAIANEHGQHQLRRREMSFADEVAERGGATEPTGAILRKTGHLLWLGRGNLGKLAKLDEQTGSAPRSNLGRQSFASGFGRARIEPARAAHYVSPGQVGEHTI